MQMLLTEDSLPEFREGRGREMVLLVMQDAPPMKLLRVQELDPFLKLFHKVHPRLFPPLLQFEELP